MKHLLYIIAIVLAFASCKPGIPSDVLSEGQMVDVLYDMHLAQAMSEDRDIIKNQEEVIALRASVLEKHGLTQKEWDRSFHFYCAHTDFLAEVYQSLEEKINEDVIALGGKANGMESNASDSLNIWNEENHIFLLQQAPFDKVSFTIIPDTTVHDGDRINLQYDSQLLFQDGTRDITVSMNVYYDRSKTQQPDSICTRTNRISSNGSGVISISNDVDRLHIKKITGFFLMMRQLSSDAVTGNIPVFRLAVIKNIQLLHLPTHAPARPSHLENKEQKDSLSESTGQQPSDQPGGQQPSGQPAGHPITKFVSSSASAD